MPDNFIVNKHNEFITMTTKKRSMSLLQNRILDAVIATIQHLIKNNRINEDMSSKEDKIICIDYDLFYNCLLEGTSLKRIRKDELKQALDDLVSLTVQFENEKEFGSMSIFSKAVIDKEENKLLITFNQNINSSHLFPQKTYTKIVYHNLNSFKSAYSRILYQHIKMLLGSKEVSFKESIFLNLENIIKIFSINKDQVSYLNSAGTLIRKCIQEPVEDIMKNEKSDVIVSYEIKRSGRKIVGVQLYFSNRKVNYDSEYLQNDFKSFKNSVLKNYRGKFIVQGVNGYEIHTKFYLNEDGLIVNGSNNKVLNSDAAFSVWSFLYKNQELLGKTLSVEEILLRKYKYRLFELNGEDFSLIDIENSKAENSITIVIENKDKKIGRIFDIKIENFQNFQWKG
ncbi:replication initiation protein [Helicobacter colisuis]|uniref:replication initiation protein n=1 Tax=Helicobacter colisuis TaxID=2949739 RepID=UPI0025433410|nr:replication initiation protein [Helicobacter colisuis]